MMTNNDFDDSDDDIFDADLCALLDSTVADLSALKNNQENARDSLQRNAVLPQIREQTEQGGGLKWNAASSLSRAVAQKRATPPPPLAVGRLLPMEGRDRPPVTKQLNNGIELPQKAQISEMQRQLDSYKQQLIFKQQEIEELKRQTTRVNHTVEVGGRTKRFQSPSSITIQGEKESPMLVSSKRRLEQPMTPSVEKSTLSGDGNMPCLVPMRRVSLGSQLTLVEILDNFERSIDGVRQYRRARLGVFLFAGQEDDVGNAVLVNLESALLLRKHANLKDIFTLSLSAINHVIVVDCAMLMDKYQDLVNRGIGVCSNADGSEASGGSSHKSFGGHTEKELQKCMHELIQFVRSLFSMLNELVMDTGTCQQMIELIQDPVDPLDVIKPVEKNVAHNIVQILDTILSLEEYSRDCVENTVASIVQFMQRSVRLRTESTKSMFAPVLKSRQIQQMLLRYPSIRKQTLMLIMIFLEDKSTLIDMEQSASQNLQVPSSERLLRDNQYQTPETRMGYRTRRRHSMTQEKIDRIYNEESYPWASTLVQTVSLCLSMDHDVSDVGSWETVRMCLAFFANILDRFSESLLASVLLRDKLELYDVQGMFQPGKMPEHLGVVKPIPLYLVDLVDKASGALRSPVAPHLALLHPTSVTDIASRKICLKMLRIVQESLMLLRGLMAHSTYGMQTTRLLAEDNNWVLCVLEKMSNYPDSSTSRFPEGYPLALWVRRMKLKNETGQQDDLCYPTVSVVIHVSRMMKFAVLKQLDSDK